MTASDQPFQEIIARRGLRAVMETGGWQQFMKIVAEMPFPPPYTMKLITDAEGSQLDEDVTYWGDYAVLAKGFDDVEWISVRPSYLKSRGRLVAPELVEYASDFREALVRARIPFEEANGSFLIFGYR